MDEIERLFERMSRQFENASHEWESSDLFEWPSSQFEPMAVDLVEHDDEFVASVDLPGFDREDVSIEVTDHTLRISAEREEETAEEDTRYLRHERHHASAGRSIRLPEEVDRDAVSARMQNGVLTITLPRIEAEAAKKIEIQ
jgi:HSP20 family protein